MPNYTTTRANAQQMLNDIYSGLIAPQGGLYQPGAPVMLPPSFPTPPSVPQMAQYQSPYDAAYQPGIPTSSAYQGGWGSQAFGGAPTPPPMLTADNGRLSASGTMVAGKDQSRLPQGDPGQAFAYGAGIPSVPTAPGLSALNLAMGLGSMGPSLGSILGNPGQTDWSVANQGGQGLFGPNNAPSSLPPNPPPIGIRVNGGTPMPSAPTPPRTPAFHAALMALQQLTTPASQAAVAAGRGGYVVKGGNSSPAKRGRNGSALGENALMPTRAMDGSLRYTYGD